ncbi:uncharacterized protein LOC135497053 [Lineus longissimus]|uniref:uncharacterized protein LOC135497053 n=1 Tax=Lineus longissimus TaxID=88925 RepID=UPI00315D8C23
MKVEATKKNMDQTKMKVLMDRTFADRRRLVVTEGYSVQQIKEQYPSLFTAKEFADEYYRISDRYLDEFDLALVNKGGGILQIPAKGKTKEDLQRLTDDSEVIQASLIKLACSLKEDVSWLFAKEEKAPKTPFPHIIADGDILDSKEYRLVADDTEFLVVGSLAEAVKLMMASYYIFNINYPPPIKCTLIFLQGVFLGVLDDQKLPMKLHTLSDKMERVA